MLSLPTLVSLSCALVAFNSIPRVHAHNYLTCTNTKPNLTKLLARETGYDFTKDDGCDGYPRAFPAENAPFRDLVNDQGYPWQYIWPTVDGIALRNHRACHWLQENPIYDSSKSWTVVKPGATIMLRAQTNNHAHEYADRPAGHYKIYLAGSSNTQIKTADQLTDDRVVFKAPMNKYAHITGGPQFDDPQNSWLPFKLIDPTGKYLPPGIYNFVWAFWWPTGDQPQKNYMLPSYTTCFDIEIREDAKDPGFLTELINSDPDAHIKLIGTTSSPGAKDHTSPWPPYANNYLNNNYEGGDPNTPVGKRTFAPYWSAHIDSEPMKAPFHGEIVAIKSWTEDQREAKLPISDASAARFFPDLSKYPSASTNSGEGGQMPGQVNPVGVGGSTAGSIPNGGSSGGANTSMTMPGNGAYDGGTTTPAAGSKTPAAGGSQTKKPSSPIVAAALPTDVATQGSSNPSGSPLPTPGPSGGVCYGSGYPGGSMSMTVSVKVNGTGTDYDGDEGEDEPCSCTRSRRRHRSRTHTRTNTKSPSAGATATMYRPRGVRI